MWKTRAVALMQSMIQRLHGADSACCHAPTHPYRDGHDLSNGGALSRSSLLSRSLRKRSSEGGSVPAAPSGPSFITDGPQQQQQQQQMAGEDTGRPPLSVKRQPLRSPAAVGAGGMGNVQQHRTAAHDMVGMTPTRSSSSRGGGGLAAASSSSDSGLVLPTSTPAYHSGQGTPGQGGTSGVGGGIRGLAGSVGGVATAAAGFGGGLFAGASSILSKAAAHVAGTDMDPTLIHTSNERLSGGGGQGATPTASTSYDGLVAKLRSQVSEDHHPFSHPLSHVALLGSWIDLVDLRLLHSLIHMRSLPGGFSQGPGACLHTGERRFERPGELQGTNYRVTILVPAG